MVSQWVSQVDENSERIRSTSYNYSSNHAHCEGDTQSNVRKSPLALYSE